MKCVDCGEEKKSRNGERCPPCGHKRIARANRERGWNAPSTVRKLTDIEAAWVGASIQADGSVTARVNKEGFEDVDVRFYSSEIETIATILRLIGAGYVYYREPRVDDKWPADNGRKPAWVWSLQRKTSVRELLKQIAPYLTSKQAAARQGIALLTPIAGGSCHPSHNAEIAVERAKARKRLEDDQAQLRVDQDRIALRPSPRAIRRQHRWRLGHDPVDSDDHDDPDVAYLKLIEEAPPGAPDQRDELHGGPDSGMPCLKYECDEKMKIVGRKNLWDIYHQPEVSVVNLKDMTEKRKRELKETYIVILACALHPSEKMQMREDMLPHAE